MGTHKADVGGSIRHRKKPVDEILGNPTATREPNRNPETQRVPKPKPTTTPRINTRQARGVKKTTYSLPLEVIESVTKKHAELFTARPGKPVIDKSQIAAAAIRLGLQDDAALRHVLGLGDE